MQKRGKEKMNPIIPVPVNEPIRIVIERRYETNALQNEVIHASTNDPEREIFIDFLKESSTFIRETLARVDSEYPELLSNNLK